MGKRPSTATSRRPPRSCEATSAAAAAAAAEEEEFVVSLSRALFEGLVEAKKQADSQQSSRSRRREVTSICVRAVLVAWCPEGRIFDARLEHRVLERLAQCKEKRREKEACVKEVVDSAVSSLECEMRCVSAKLDKSRLALAQTRDALGAASAARDAAEREATDVTRRSAGLKRATATARSEATESFAKEAAALATTRRELAEAQKAGRKAAAELCCSEDAARKARREYEQCEARRSLLKAEIGQQETKLESVSAELEDAVAELAETRAAVQVSQTLRAAIREEHETLDASLKTNVVAHATASLERDAVIAERESTRLEEDEARETLEGVYVELKRATRQLRIARDASEAADSDQKAHHSDIDAKIKATTEELRNVALLLKEDKASLAEAHGELHARREAAHAASRAAKESERLRDHSESARDQAERERRALDAEAEEMRLRLADVRRRIRHVRQHQHEESSNNLQSDDRRRHQDEGRRGEQLAQKQTKKHQTKARSSSAPRDLRLSLHTRLSLGNRH